MQSYRELDVYKIAHRLAVQVHGLTMRLPKFELYEEGSQVRRSSKSVPANIVEGFCRKRYQQEYLRYLVFAHGSCNETIEHLELLHETDSLERAVFAELTTEYEELGRKLNRLIQTVAAGLEVSKAQSPRLKAHSAVLP